MMILLIVPVICVLDFVSATQKNQILNGNGWDILESIISNCPNHYANCVGQLASDYRQGQDSDISKSKDLFRKYYEQPVHSASDGQRDESVSPEKQMGKELKRAEREVSQSMDEPEEDDFDFSDEDVSEEESRAEEKAAGDGFRGVTEEDEIPFSGDEEETQEDEAESEDDKVEKAKAVVCNFGYFQGRTLGEMLETPKGWESLKWIVTRYKGANTQMKEAATILVEADAYMPKAA